MKLCHKECFSKKEAQTALNHCKKEHRKEVRIYECHICQNKGKPCWHLTSKYEWEPIKQLEEKELIFCELWKKLMK